MSPSTTPDPQKAAALVPRALLGTSVAVLVVGAFLNSQGQAAGGPEALSWAAVAWARRTVLFFAVLESAAVLAGIAAIVSPPAWPLAAGLVPVAVMVLNLPPRG